MKKEIKDFSDLRDGKMLSRQRVLFRAFFVNLILGLIVWGLTFVPAFLYVAVLVTGISPMMMYFSMIGGIALWQMLGVVMFLVPALATWWERKVIK